MVKQVILMRTDLNMRKGKMIAQGAHASMKIFFDRKIKSTPKEMHILLEENMHEWIEGDFTKICLKVGSEIELDELCKSAETSGLPVAQIVDAGKTEFNGVPTKTCAAIGPANSEMINSITGHLKLM